jgi:hypothetical protein
VECEEYKGRVFTHWRGTGLDREPSHQTGNGAADSLSLLILIYADTKNGGKSREWQKWKGFLTEEDG